MQEEESIIEVFNLTKEFSLVGREEKVTAI